MSFDIFSSPLIFLLLAVPHPLKHYTCQLLSTVGDASQNPQPLWSALLLFGQKELDEYRLKSDEGFDDVNRSITLPLIIWKRIRYSMYRYVATRLGYQSRKKYYECVYGLIEMYFSKSTVGFLDVNDE